MTVNWCFILKILFHQTHLHWIKLLNLLCVRKTFAYASIKCRFQDECPNVALKEESILVKIQLPTLISSLSHAIVFDKEGEMYSYIFPKMKTLLNQLHESAKLLPELIGICANKAISIEDLSVKGYSISSKLIGLNLSDAKLVLHKAAIFHATCAVLQEHESNIFENFKHGTKLNNSC